MLVDPSGESKAVSLSKKMMKPDPNPARPHPMIGRFVARLPGVTHRGLAAHEVTALLARIDETNVEIYRINRVGEDGRMELVGVSPEALTSETAVGLGWSDVAIARRSYDRLAAWTDECPPPCVIEVQLVRNPSRQASAMVALVFCLACDDAVGHWLRCAGLDACETRDAGRAVMDSLRGGGIQVILRRRLEPKVAP